MAVKKLIQEVDIDEGANTEFDKEIRFMRSIRHPNIGMQQNICGCIVHFLFGCLINFKYFLQCCSLALALLMAARSWSPNGWSEVLYSEYFR